MEKLANKMWDAVEELCDQLKEQLPNYDYNLLMTDDDDKGVIWGYVLIDGRVEEKQVKALRLKGNEVYVLIDDSFIVYEREDALMDDGCWYSLKHGDVLTLQTAYYIAENIQRFL